MTWQCAWTAFRRQFRPASKGFARDRASAEGLPTGVARSIWPRVEAVVVGHRLDSGYRFRRDPSRSQGARRTSAGEWRLDGDAWSRMAASQRMGRGWAARARSNDVLRFPVSP